MISLLEATKPYIDNFAGIRISTRPDYIDEDVLALLKSYNVTTIELGAKYHTYVNKPFTVTSSDELKYAIYVEDFSEDIVLVPGVNIINGHKWTYSKNSTFGSAEIKSGRLYFVFEKLNVIIEK